MTAEEVERFEASAGDLLDELSYPRAVPCPRPEALEHASEIRNLLAQDATWKQLATRPRAESQEIAPRPPDFGVGDRRASASSEGRS
jgi:hypothetical protein